MKTTNLLTPEDLIEAAHAAFADGDLATARQRLDTALTMDPKNAELAVAVGHFKLHAGDVAGALVHYATAVQLMPRLAGAHSSQALALVLLGRSDEAEASALEALSLKPHDCVALKVLTRLLLDRNRVDEAQRIAGLILQLNPGDTEAEQFLEQVNVRRAMLRVGQLPNSMPLPGLVTPGAPEPPTMRSADHPPPTTAGI
jgi:Flp pilus assembly protein TadD